APGSQPRIGGWRCAAPVAHHVSNASRPIGRSSCPTLSALPQVSQPGGRMLRRLSMVLALAAAVGCTDTSETSDGAVAADDGELAAERAPAVASSPPATGTAAQQATNIPCPGKHVEREVRVTK